MSATEARYCPNCGAAHDPGANFCPSCGHQFGVSETGVTQPLQPVQPTQPARPAQPAQPAVQTGQPQVAQESPAPPTGVPWVPIAIGGAIVVAAAAVVLFFVLRSGGDDAEAYKEDVATLIEPIGTANEDLSAELDTFTSSSKPGPALATAREVSRATRDANAQLASLKTPESQQELRAAVDEALTGETDYLAAVIKVLTSPSAAATAGLDSWAADAHDSWSEVAQSIPGAGGTISGVAPLAKWARGRQGAGTTGGGTTGGTTGGAAGASTFIKHVESILAFSKPAVVRLSSTVSGMKAGTIDYDSAQSDITYAVDNRQEAVARASGLSAPNSAAANVKQLLVTALNRSLDNDGDYKDALQFYATEEVEAFDQAMRRAAASSGAASAAKRTFLSTYNVLRRSNGLGNTSYSTF